MNFSLDDRHRSMRRFLMNVLGSPPWTLRTERQPVKDEERPAGVVEVLAAAVTRSRTTIPQGNVERAQTFPVTLYPGLMETAAESRMVAEAVAQLLDDAISVGLSNDDGTVLTYPERIPVFDFEDVPVKGATRAGPAEPYGWLWAEDWTTQAVQDPDDPLRWSVTCPLRVSWESMGRVRPDEPAAGGLTPVPPTVWAPPVGQPSPSVPPDPDGEPGWARRGVIVP